VTLATPIEFDPLGRFDFAQRTRVIFGPGVIDRLGELVRELGRTRVLLVTDKGLAQAGHERHALDALRQADLAVTVYDDVHCNPTTDDVDRCVEVARRAKIDVIVGLGGGSSMDCAKGCNFLYSNGGKMEDYWGVGKARSPMLPMIAVPTTAGTGSEAQSFALIARVDSHMKMACGDKKAACAVALLDPLLTLTMPASVTAVTGIDAISHAVETFVTRPRTGASQVFSREAWRLLAADFPVVCREPEHVEARGAVLLGAHWAGAAIENSMLGATHAMANPLSAHFDTTHGIAIGILLPHVVRYNAAVVGSLYTELACSAGLCDHDDPQGPVHLARLLRRLTVDSGLPATLREIGVEAAVIPQLAEEATRQWTAQFNPRPVTAREFEELYRQAFQGDDVR
jgi:alcohol dehydrogenase